MGEQNGYLPFPKGFATAAIHHAQEPEQWDSMAVVAPLVTSSTFKQNGPADFKKYEYARSGNPTREILENILAHLDNAKYGVAYASGLGATSAVIGTLKTGSHVILGDDVYGGTFRSFDKVAVNFGIEYTRVEMRNIEELKKAIKENTKLIWMETPTNPTLKVIDIKAVSAVAKQHNIIVAVDNTFLTPYLQRPLEFRADVSVYSLTKYINGHLDVIMGAVTTNDKELYDKLRFVQNAMGIVPSPFDCYQVIRSLKTLPVRMQQHLKNSLAVAQYLENHPKVEKVLHPGLASHSGYELSKKQTSGYSGMVSFYLKGSLKESKTFLQSLKIFTIAGSLGGCESLVEMPSVMSHASVPAKARELLEITDNFIRMSVGIEDVNDLLDDLEQALQKI